MWPAKEAPYYKHGWQSALALIVLVIVMTCALRYIDVRFLRSKHQGPATTLDEETVLEEAAGVHCQTIELNDKDAGRNMKIPESDIVTSSVGEGLQRKC